MSSKSDSHEVSNKKLKGERETHRKPNIHLYPIAKSDGSSETTQEEYQSFPALRDPSGQAKDKTNVVTVRIPRMLGPMSHRAEEYCQLRTRFDTDLWSRMPKGKCDLFTKARDFASVTDPGATERKAAERAFTTYVGDKAVKIEAGGVEVPGGSECVPTNCRVGDLEMHIRFLPANSRWVSTVFNADPADARSPLSSEGLMERIYWECMAREIFRSPHEAYTVQLEYLQHDIRKPYNEKFTHFKHRVEELFSYLKYYPAPCKRSCFPTNDEMDVRDAPVSTTYIRKAVYNALPKSWHEAFEKRTPEDVLSLSEEEFMTTFNTIEEEDLRNRTSQEKKKDENSKPKSNKRTQSGSGNGGEVPNKKMRHSKFCKKCKELGRSQAAYTSHNASECTWKDGKQSAQSSLTSNSHGNDFRKMKKEFKAMKKMLANLEKKSKRAADSDSDSDSDDE